MEGIQEDSQLVFFLNGERVALIAKAVDPRQSLSEFLHGSSENSTRIF